MNNQNINAPPIQTICNSTLQDEMNRKLYDRNVPSSMLQPYIDFRPAMTKYSYFPIVEPTRQINVKLQQQPTYNIQNTFNPGNTQSPWSGFATNINTESELRNQIYALQKCSQSVYVPNSSSDLYSYNFKTKTQPNPHDLLFNETKFPNFNPNPNDKLIGYNMFMNNTRNQLKDLSHSAC
jgi:hypothetical protein